MYAEARSKPSKWAYNGGNKDIDLSKRWYPAMNDIPCAHLRCTECGGSGTKADGSTCVHMISCRCKQCSPICM